MEAQLQQQSRTVTEKISFQDYLKAYDSFEGGRTEWLAGEVAIYPTNGTTHQFFVQFFALLLDTFLATNSLGEVLLGGIAMFISDEQPAREPDLMVVLTEHEARVKQTYLEGVADIAIEVVSPESVARDRGEKFSEYEAVGVPEYWLIDPQRMEIRVYSLNADGVYQPVELDDQGRIRSRVLPTFALDPAILWGEQLPRAPQIIALVEKMG